MDIDIVLKVLIFVFGALLVLMALSSAIRSFVLPRSDNVFLTRMVFMNVNRLLQLRVRRVKTYAQKDHIMAFYAPLTLLILPVVWLISVLVGYTCMLWALGAGDGTGLQEGGAGPRQMPARLPGPDQLHRAWADLHLPHRI